MGPFLKGVLEPALTINVVFKYRVDILKDQYFDICKRCNQRLLALLDEPGNVVDTPRPQHVVNALAIILMCYLHQLGDCAHTISSLLKCLMSIGRQESRIAKRFHSKKGLNSGEKYWLIVEKLGVVRSTPVKADVEKMFTKVREAIAGKESLLRKAELIFLVH